MTRFRPPASPTRLAFSPDGRTLAVRGYVAVYLFDSFAGRLDRTLTAPPAIADGPLVMPVGDLAFSPDGRRLAAAWDFADGVVVWDVPTGRALSRLHYSATTPAFTPDGERLVLADVYFLLLEAATGGDVLLDIHPSGRSFHGPLAVWCEAADRAAVAEATQVRRYSLADGRELSITRLPAGLVATAARPTAGGLVLVGHRHTRARLAVSVRRLLGRPADTPTAWEVGVLTAAGYNSVPGAGPLTAFNWAASPDGRQVAVEREQVVQVLDLARGCWHDFDPGLGRVTAVAFSPDGLRLAAAGSHGVAVWDVDG